MRRPSVLVVFALSALGWTIALTLLWAQVSAWTSYPVAALSHIALEQGAPMWVRSVQRSPGAMDVDTTIAMPAPGAQGGLAEITVQADPARYAYGLPILLALLLAARGPRRGARAVAGYLLLLPVQALSLTFFVLMQMVLYAQGSARVLKAAQWQIEGIIYGYQFSALVLPTLAPILLWLWLDQRFVRDVLIAGWQASAVSPSAPAFASVLVPASHSPSTRQSPASPTQASVVPVVPIVPVAPPLQAGAARARPPVEISSSSSAVLPSAPPR